MNLKDFCNPNDVKEAYEQFLIAGRNLSIAEENRINAAKALDEKTASIQREFKDISDARVLQYAITKETVTEKEMFAKAEAELRMAQSSYRQIGIKVDMLNRLVETVKVYMALDT